MTVMRPYAKKFAAQEIFLSLCLSLVVSSFLSVCFLLSSLFVHFFLSLSYHSFSFSISLFLCHTSLSLSVTVFFFFLLLSVINAPVLSFYLKPSSLFSPCVRLIFSVIAARSGSALEHFSFSFLARSKLNVVYPDLIMKKAVSRTLIAPLGRMPARCG